MHIGIDIDVLGGDAPQSGIYNYIWNITSGICRADHRHQVSLFLYGEPNTYDTDRLRLLREWFPQAELRFWFDGFPPKLLTGLPGMPWRVGRHIDRRVLLPLWQKLLVPNTRLVSWLSRRNSPSATVDLLHLPGGISFFPLHQRANVVTVHDLTTRRFAQFHAKDTIECYEELYDSLSDIDIIITPSEHAKQDLVEMMGVAADRIHVTPEAAHARYRPEPDRERVRAVLAKHGLSERPYLLTVGTLEPRKNHARLIEAFHRLRQQRPTLEHQLVLVGGKGWMYEPIFEAIAAYGLEAHVKWLGFVPVEDLPALLNGAELFVYPSLYEGFGLPPLEAMACGTPVVAARSSSLPEVVGDAGLLVDPYRVEEIADAMGAVLADGRLREELRDRGLQRAATFSWEKTARLTLAAYEQALAHSLGNGRRRSPGGRRNGHQKQMRQAVLQMMLERASATI